MQSKGEIRKVRTVEFPRATAIPSPEHLFLTVATHQRTAPQDRPWLDTLLVRTQQTESERVTDLPNNRAAWWQASGGERSGSNLWGAGVSFPSSNSALHAMHHGDRFGNGSFVHYSCCAVLPNLLAQITQSWVLLMILVTCMLPLQAFLISIVFWNSFKSHSQQFHPNQKWQTKVLSSRRLTAGSMSLKLKKRLRPLLPSSNLTPSEMTGISTSLGGRGWLCCK